MQLLLLAPALFQLSVGHGYLVAEPNPLRRQHLVLVLLCSDVPLVACQLSVDFDLLFLLVPAQKKKDVDTYTDFKTLNICLQ